MFTLDVLGDVIYHINKKGNGGTKEKCQSCHVTKDT